VWRLSDRGDATSAAAISEDGRWAAIGFPKGLVIVHDLSNGSERGRRRLDWTPERLWLGPGGDVVVASDGAGAVFVWSDALGFSHKFDARDPLDAADPGGVRTVAISADRRLLAVSPRRRPQGLLSVAVWDLVTGRRYDPPPSLSPTSDTLQFTPDGRSLILGGPRSPRIWRLEPPEEPPSPIGHTDEAWSAAFSSDGSLLATGSDDQDDRRTIKIWDPSTAALRQGWYAGMGTVASLAFSPVDDRVLASGQLADSGNVRLWDVVEGKLIADLIGHTDWVRTVAFSPDGSRLASGDRKGKIVVWDIASRRPLYRVNAHTDAVRSVAFSPDGSRLASVSTEGTLRLWDAATGSPLREDASPMKLASLAFSPDGAQIATADEDGFILLRDATTLALIRTIRGDIDMFFDIAFAPDGRSLVTSSKSGAVRFWDTLIGQELLSIKAHDAQVNGLAFSPDGRTLVSCGHDGSVRFWRSAPGDPYEPRPDPRLGE
jgi:WD40 repeat protein